MFFVFYIQSKNKMFKSCFVSYKFKEYLVNNGLMNKESVPMRIKLKTNTLAVMRRSHTTITPSWLQWPTPRWAGRCYSKGRRCGASEGSHLRSAG